MRTAVGIFTSRPDAERAVERLRAVLPEGRINILAPGDSEARVHSVRTAEDMAPGLGRALGGVVGGVTGVTAALSLMPLVGPVVAVGTVATALAGVGGAVVGAKVGEAADQGTLEGLPRDELYLYEHALRNGRTVVFALAGDEKEQKAARSLLAEAGAESLDAARESWWVGIRSAEELEYGRAKGGFEADEPVFRRGFEAALAPGARGRTFHEAAETLRKEHPDAVDAEAFRRGFERGRLYHERLRESHRH
jgi:hypothetical protein